MGGTRRQSWAVRACARVRVLCVPIHACTMHLPLFTRLPAALPPGHANRQPPHGTSSRARTRTRTRLGRPPPPPRVRATGWAPAASALARPTRRGRAVRPGSRALRVPAGPSVRTTRAFPAPIDLHRPSDSAIEHAHMRGRAHSPPSHATPHRSHAYPKAPPMRMAPSHVFVLWAVPVRAPCRVLASRSRARGFSPSSGAPPGAVAAIVACPDMPCSAFCAAAATIPHNTGNETKRFADLASTS